jgi:cysteine desulfurase
MERIYLDHAATTAVHPEAAEVVRLYMTEKYGNASSLHLFGEEAKDSMEEGRAKISSILGCASDEIIFTSGGTEADNAALIGYALKNASKGNHILVSSIEHEGVLSPARYLNEQGFEVELLESDSNGVIPFSELCKKLRSDTILVSVMWVNNETGVIQPIQAFSQELKARNIIFHTDAVQAIGKIPVDLSLVDLLSASAHKFYGPKGVGFLFCRQGVQLHPIIHGGGHEKNLRSGTENVSGIMGMAKALEICQNNRVRWNQKYVIWKRKILEIIHSLQGHVNGSVEMGIPNLLNVSFPGISGEALAASLSFEGIAVSTSSACASHHHSPESKISHVLKAMGYHKERLLGSIRVSTGFDNTDDEIQVFCNLLGEIIPKIRSIGGIE